jgi:hypothetical protein
VIVDFDDEGLNSIEISDADLDQLNWLQQNLFFSCLNLCCLAAMGVLKPEEFEDEGITEFNPRTETNSGIDL